MDPDSRALWTRIKQKEAARNVPDWYCFSPIDFPRPIFLGCNNKRQEQRRQDKFSIRDAFKHFLKIAISPEQHYNYSKWLSELKKPDTMSMESFVRRCKTLRLYHSKMPHLDITKFSKFPDWNTSPFLSRCCFRSIVWRNMPEAWLHEYCDRYPEVRPIKKFTAEVNRSFRECDDVNYPEDTISISSHTSQFQKETLTMHGILCFIEEKLKHQVTAARDRNELR